MAASVDIAPSVGTTASFLQAGPGASPGYDAVDVRRAALDTWSEGVLSRLAWKVSQRAAGANMSVDVDADVAGAIVTGDATTAQGQYHVPLHSANINVDIAAADGSHQRNDLIILEIKDDTHDSGGSNVARVRVVTGTPNGSAAKTDALGVNGTPSLPASSIALAVVNVPATDTTIETAQADDRRGLALPKLVVPACRVYDATGFNFVNGALTKYPFDTASFDTGPVAMFDAANNRIYARQAGLYRISAISQWNFTTAADLLLRIYVNGTTKGQNQTHLTGGANGYSTGVSMTWSASAADYFELFYYQDAGTPAAPTGEAASQLSVEWISAAS